MTDDMIHTNDWNLTAQTPISTGSFIIAIDGACLGNPGPGGWAAIITQEEQRTTRSGQAIATTNNRMELSAAIEAVSCLPPFAEALILSDSNLVVQGVNEWRKSWRHLNWKKSNGKPVMNRDLWERLDSLIEAHDGYVQFRWVKAHAGHALNEEADTLTSEEAAKAQATVRRSVQ